MWYIIALETLVSRAGPVLTGPWGEQNINFCKYSPQISPAMMYRHAYYIIIIHNNNNNIICENRTQLFPIMGNTNN